MKRELTTEVWKRFVAGECSNEERLMVLEWIKSTPDTTLRDSLLTAHWQNLKPSDTEGVNFDKLFDTVDKKIQHDQGIFFKNNSYGILKIAAAFIGLMVLATVVYLLTSGPQVYKTEYGEIKKFYLPDSSKVLLNGNSKLTLNGSWDDHSAREVTLEGEGFFSVRHTSNDLKFMVRTSDSLTIEVLGTKFNVSSRRSGTKVTLKEGSIRLNILTNNPKKSVSESLLMEPGELVSFKSNVSQYKKKKVDTELYTAWRKNRLVLDYTSLQEIIYYLEETEGLKVRVSTPELLRLRGSGTMPTQNINMLLNVVAETFNLEVKRSKNDVYFSKKMYNPKP